MKELIKMLIAEAKTVRVPVAGFLFGLLVRWVAPYRCSHEVLPLINQYLEMLNYCCAILVAVEIVRRVALLINAHE